MRPLRRRFSSGEGLRWRWGMSLRRPRRNERRRMMADDSGAGGSAGWFERRSATDAAASEAVWRGSVAQEGGVGTNRTGEWVFLKGVRGGAGEARLWVWLRAGEVCCRICD